VLLGLRLLQEGDIGLGSLNIIWGNALLEPTTVDLADSSFGGWRYFSDSIPTYTLSAEDAKTLQTIWAFMARNRSKKRKRLALTVRRFQSSFRRTSSEDRLIDHWIALEALFSSEGSETTFRMSQLLAQFIGRDPLDRWETFKRAKELYGVRSDIVHGRTIDHSTLDAQIALTEDFLRRALLACMKQRSAPDLGKLGRDVFLQGIDIKK